MAKQRGSGGESSEAGGGGAGGWQRRQPRRRGLAEVAATAGEGSVYLRPSYSKGETRGSNDSGEARGRQVRVVGVREDDGDRPGGQRHANTGAWAPPPFTAPKREREEKEEVASFSPAADDGGSRALSQVDKGRGGR